MPTMKSGTPQVNLPTGNYALATFAGGCFRCMQPWFDWLSGVVETIVGYAGGTEENPTYEQVAYGETTHRESIQVTYDPTKVTYEQLLEEYLVHIDPTDPYGQFSDKWMQYTTAIFYRGDEQKTIAEEFLKKQAVSGKYEKRIVTKILPFTTFYPAEEYHQKYYLKAKERYNSYKNNSWRPEYFDEMKQKEEELKTQEGASVSWQNLSCDTWIEFDPNKKYDKGELKSKLTDLQYFVTQENGTEVPFNNEYWNNHEEGIYVDVISGKPLFSSTDKFDSGTGWPSFTKPIESGIVTTQEDGTLGMSRTEIRSADSDAHLGHVFNDGPVDKGGQRFCVNSASLKFIPKSQMEAAWYGDYLYLFAK